MQILISPQTLIKTLDAFHGWRRLALRVALVEVCVLLGMLITPQLQIWLPRRVSTENRGLAVRQLRASLGDPRNDPRVGTPAPPFLLQDASGTRVSIEEFQGRRTVLVFAEGST